MLELKMIDSMLSWSLLRRVRHAVRCCVLPEKNVEWSERGQISSTKEGGPMIVKNNVKKEKAYETINSYTLCEKTCHSCRQEES